MSTETELRDAAACCRRLARGVTQLGAIGLIALAFEYEDRANKVAGGLHAPDMRSAVDPDTHRGP